MPLKLAIVEDNSALRESLGVLIQGASGFSFCGGYPNAEVALKKIPFDWPDVILMDINLPKMSGIELVAKLKEMRPQLQILMLTAYEDDEQIFNSLMAGANGYLLKETPPSEILDAVLDVQRGGAPMSNSIARKVVHHFQQKKPKNETENLSKRELEILTHLAKGYQCKEIADLLTISVMTVRNHLHNIYEKLHVRTRTEAVVKFLDSGKRP
jgi:DNA-binding NarL/FixJ family response regulator